MYETIQAVSHILDLDQLLERILELIFRSIEADRGCIMLCNPDSGQLEPKAVRCATRRSAVTEKMALSRTIMDHVLREKQGVLVSDAAARRALQHRPEHRPLRHPRGHLRADEGPARDAGRALPRHAQHGRATWWPATAPTGKFTEDHLALAIAIAHQAALAVEETRYHQAMVQAERLAAIGQTIAALSHHIKNILARAAVAAARSSTWG